MSDAQPKRPKVHQITATLRTAMGAGHDRRVYSEAALRAMQQQAQTGPGVPVRDHTEGEPKDVGKVVGMKYHPDGRVEVIARVERLPPTLHRLVEHGHAEFVASGAGHGHRDTPDGPLVIDVYDLVAVGLVPRRDPGRLCTFCHRPMKHLGNDIWGCDAVHDPANGGTTRGGANKS